MNKSEEIIKQQNRTSILEQTLCINESVTKSKRHVLWGLVNSLALAVLLFNILQESDDDSLQAYVMHKGKLIMIVYLIFNVLFHLVKYSLISFNLSPVTVSPSQKRFLRIGRSAERWFKSPESSSSRSPSANDRTSENFKFTATTPMNLSATSWLSPTTFKENNMSSANYSLGRSSQVYEQPSFVRANPFPRSPDEDIIRDERSLLKYLTQAGEMERRATMTAEQPGSVLGSFWNNTGPRTNTDVSPLLRRCTYQMSSTSPVQPSGSSSPGSVADESGSPSSSLNSTELWRRIKVDPSTITQWNANLRMWISLTILERLVKEFDYIDEAFVKCGLSDLHVGSVGLDRLKKTASIPQVVASVPSLPRLVPFLEISPHQEYVVNRIRELAKGGSMSEFRWNSGGFLNGKNWEEHLPTDATLVMHLMATYLDLQLLPPPHRPDARPFSLQYLFRSPEKPRRGGSSPVMYQSQLSPPHFVIVDKDEVFDVPKGRNNMFYAFLAFLHLLKTREHGMLGPVNLGRSGVNILWVIDS